RAMAMASIVVQVSALLLNLIAFGLAVAAEQRRSKATVTPDLAKEYDYCFYDSDVATGYGVGALLLLVAAQAVVMLASRCFCCGRGLKPGGSRACALMLTFLVAAACLLAGSVRNAYHTRYRGIFNGDPLSCETLRKGVFAAGAAFTFFTAILSEFYYISYSKSRD
uniref:CASP-like protein n=1 Tax=Aegilops tauschii subsp. strangulata TaxID=200361 RepID=A0A453G8Q6_AEGTS